MAERLVEESSDKNDKNQVQPHTNGQAQKSKVYKSRRERNYEDNLSEDDITNEGYQDTQDESYAFKKTDGQEIKMKPHPMFRNNRGQFKHLLKQHERPTMYPIQTVTISYDSQRAITVTKRNEREYWVRVYDLESYEQLFEEKFGGSNTDYIKMKEIEQNSEGNKYAVAYNNDGHFRVRVIDVFQDEFGKTKRIPDAPSRTPEQIEKAELKINEELGIDNWTMAIDGFPDPFIVCCFIADDLIFVNLFYNHKEIHYHFIFNTELMHIEGEKVKMELKSSIKNFPYKCFYNPDLNEIYSFYRQGYSFIINKDDPTDYLFDRMTEMDLGQMYLIFNQCMAIRSSSQILFFKIEKEEFTERRKWIQYDSIQSRGLIFYIKGNIRIQVTSDEYIQFYLIDQETLKPKLENVMYNFMNCNQMMFGSRVRYCITYKTNQRSFTIYRRKYEHNFKIPVVEKNLEGSKCLELENHDMFLCTNIDEVNMYDIEKFERLDQLEIPLLKDTEAREPNEIIAIQKCQNEKYIAIISGKRLISNEEKINQLFVFKYIEGSRNIEEGVPSKFELIKRIILKDRPEFQQTCMNFHFKSEDGEERSKIIFAQKDKIFSLNFMDENAAPEIIYRFKDGHEMKGQPTFFCTNDEQSIFVVASDMDCIYVNMNSKEEIDIDHEHNISLIKQITFDEEDKVFYILSNKYGPSKSQKLGFYLIQIGMENPKKDWFFLIKWKNKLDIDDCNIQVLRADDYARQQQMSKSGRFTQKQKMLMENEKGSELKEIIISFKQIFINTYNVICMDISHRNDQEGSGKLVQNKLVFRHERFQLWESEIQGFLTKKKLEFITVNREGINILGLNSKEEPRYVKDAEGYERRLHSLESMNYLNLNKANSLYFDCSKQTDRWVQVQQEYTKEAGGDKKSEDKETMFEPIYKIKIWNTTLRELLIFQSIYLCQTTSAIVDIVNAQPTPMIFYKSFLEFDGSNMVSILSFDSRSMQHLLQDSFSDYFMKDSPIFYRTKTQKGGLKQYRFFYRSAIDNALRNNQLKAAQLIVNYICKYQDNLYSSYLFSKNFSQLFEKGINMVELLNSNVFNWTFDYDEWPSSHFDDCDVSKPYNGSVFDIRYQKTYTELFPEIEEMKDEENVDSQGKKRQIYKIKYTINLLPRLAEHISIVDGQKTKMNGGTCIMTMCVNSGDLEVFDTDSIQELISFKWTTFGQFQHMIGLIFHTCQIIMLIIYINFVYINDFFEIYKEGTQPTIGHPQSLFAFSLLICLLWPIFYEAVRMQKEGLCAYFKNMNNYAQLLYVMASILMTICHVLTPPQLFISKLIMILVIALSIARTFKQMRIIEVFAHIVEMLFQVGKDLQVFIFFYGIIIVLFSMLISVLGIGNPNIEKDFRDAFPAKKEGTKEELDARGDTPNSEYRHITLVVGHMIDIIKVSVGDFGIISKSMYTVDIQTNYLFWVCWFVIALIACIIFLNFIIAEASASYEKVSSQIEETILKAKAQLIAEAEMMRPLVLKNEVKFPKYIITRKVER